MPLQSSQPLELVSSMQVVPARQCNSVPCLYLCICLCSWAVSSLPPYAVIGVSYSKGIVAPPWVDD